MPTQSVFPTQTTLGCASSSCTYGLECHVSAQGAPAGEWVLRGSAHLRAVSGGGVGAQRYVTQYYGGVC